MSHVYPNLRGRVLDWHDGDTAHIDVELPFSMMAAAYTLDGSPTLSCRLQGINPATQKIEAVNAPELATDAGKAALAYVQQLCPPGTLVTACSTSWDKYGGRWDGQLTLPNGVDIGSAMVAAGQAVWMTV